MVDESDAPTVIRAAGGLLWRKVGGRKELAVIQRTRYGGDWTLPKGKLEPGERWPDAALREVQEETQCRGCLGSFAGSVIYPVDGVPKVVLFWNMTLVGDCRFVPSDEVDALQWLPVKEALRTLDYAGERALVEANLEESAAGSTLRARVRRGWSRLSRIRRPSSYQRLASAYAAYSVELDHSIRHCKQKAETDFSWASAANRLISRRCSSSFRGRFG